MQIDVFVWSLVVAIFAIYAVTISPSIAGGDSGEIVAEGCHLGTAHPPGYPLMTLLVYALTRLPASLVELGVHALRSVTHSEVLRDTVALRVNLCCAALTALAAAFIGFIVDALSPLSPLSPQDKPRDSSSFMRLSSLPGVVLAMLLFSFSPLVWQYAITAEVFPLNTFLAAYLVYLVASFSQKRHVSTAIYGAFICGLALCNQHTIILYEAPLILWMLFLLRRNVLANFALLIKLGVAFLAGFSGYLYLPIAATVRPQAGSWGEVSSLKGFLHHFLRRDYGTFQLFSGAAGKQTEGLLERTATYWKDASETQGLYFAPYLALIGAAFSFYWIVSSSSFLRPSPSLSNDKTKRQKAEATIASAGPSESLISESECRFTPLVIIATDIFYFAVFHSLSNLPLSDPLLFGVHQRFWMQPNVLLFAFAGIGLNALSMLFCNQKNKDVTAAATAKPNLPKGGKKQKDRKINDEANHTPTVDGTSSKPSKPRNFVSVGVFVVSLLCALAAGIAQCSKWFEISNQSQVEFFRQYAAAILSPLPQNAVLVVNYDQQWTSIRYLQVCEGYRTDIRTLQLSMMTYQWFQYKHQLYNLNSDSRNVSTINFPGTYMTYPNSPAIAKDKAFTLLQFLDTNHDKHAMFLGGKITHPDPVLSAKYDLVPVGLVSQFVLMSDAPNGTVYSEVARSSWSTVRNILPVLPDSTKYPEETWEWTIGRDYKDRLMDTAAYVLSSAISSANADPFPLFDAIYWMESAFAIEGKGCPVSLLKNLGLAHLHAVQNKALPGGVMIQERVEDLLETTSKIDWPVPTQSWKDWSANKFIFYWGEFLKRPEANRDPQFTTIQNMYTQALKGVNAIKNQGSTGPKQKVKQNPGKMK